MTAITAPTAKRNKKRGTVIRLSLAGLALVGIGAAATTAAWTDNVFFSASATSSTFNLQGSTDNTTWAEGNPTGAAIVIPATAFANLLPGVPKVTTVYVKNVGTIDALLDTPTASGTGDIFAGSTPAVVSVVSGDADGVLAPNAVAPYTVTVTAPQTWNGSASYQGKLGSVSVTVPAVSNRP